MFKSWRNDKNKIKAVFKLQFQATQVPKLKKSALTISLVPDDVGKPTFKLEKAPVKDGICSWENPIYVSVKLIKEPKSGNIREKIYHFVVATGSSKSGFLGEASVDFADFLAESEPLIVSLPLKFANSGAVLHVTIHKMQGSNDQRYIEENGDPAITKEGSLKSQQSNDDLDEYNQDESSLDRWMDGPDGSNHLQQQQSSMPARKNGHQRSNTDWSASSTSDGSLIESRNSPENNSQRRLGEDSSETGEKVKIELEALRRQSELTELEMQSLRKQVTKESKRTQELSREVSCLKEERDELLEECKQLKLQKHTDEAEVESRVRSISEDSSNMIEEIRDELKFEKDLNRNLRLQLQRTQESNSNLTLAVRDLNEILEQKSREIASLNSEIEEMKKLEEDQYTDSRHMNEDEHQKVLKDEIDVLKQRIEDLDMELDSCRKKNKELEIQLKELTREYESVREENKNISLLEQQEHLKLQDGCSYSTHTVEELESQIERLEDKIKQQSFEYSECLTTINELETEVKELKKELEKQAQVFEEDLDAMMQAKTEQEQRAIQAEEELKKTRRKHAITAERLQEKCRRLSLEMESKLDKNEKLAMKTVAEANDLRMQNKNLEEMLQKAKTEISRQTEMKRLEEEKNEGLSMKVHMLEAEMENHMTLREKSNAAATETERLIQEWEKERDELERKFASAKEEAEMAQKELMTTRSSNDEKEIIVRNLKKEVEGLSQQYNELQNSFVQEKMENETHRKQVSNLKADIKKKEQDMSKILNERMKEGKSSKSPKPSISDGHKEESFTKLLDELAYFKNRNASMEKELKDMEERYSEISLKFAEVEGERQQLVMAVKNLKNGKKN